MDGHRSSGSLPCILEHVALDVQQCNSKLLRIFTPMSIIQQPGCWASATDKLNVWELFNREPPKRCALHFLIRSPSELSVKDSLGYSLLHRACLRGDAILVASLLRVGVCPSVLTDNGISAVHIAASRGQTAILYMLMRSGADLNQADSQGRIAMHYAAENDQAFTIAWLLQFPNAGQPDSVDNHGVTPFHLACSRANANALRYMLRAGRTSGSQLRWDLSAQDHCGNTCLHAAVNPSFCLGSMTQFYAKPNRANSKVHNVVWSLLTVPLLLPNGLSAISLSGMRNKCGETVFDLAKRLHSNLALTILMYLAQTLVGRFSATLALKLLLYIYAVTWVSFALLPITLSFASFLLASQFQSPFIYFTVGALSLLVFARQSHRLSDGTNRPNPFFMGAFVAGFLSTLHLVIFHLYPSPQHPDWYHHSYFVFLLIVPFVISFLFLSLVFSDPGYVIGDQQLIPFSSVDPGILYLVEKEALEISKQLSDPNPELLHSQPYQLIDLYCPHCKLHTLPSATVRIKHCKLCERCINNMDHHCLFIMKCVSYTNQRQFFLFLFVCLLFTGGYIVFTLYTLVVTCPSTESGKLWETSVCLYSRFSPCIVFLLYNIGSFLWILLLIDDQLVTINSKTPVWRRRMGSVVCNISQFSTRLRSFFCFLLFGRRPITRQRNSDHVV
ncbi:putative ZDHHC-type palmitoyltransferase 5 [Clonorchis sinensis]|uniref:Palmitoyltransferase n=1 Tax=Clonorchis sinensis TaxID=79923 RepID=A0A8T1MG19_CLOSI|nr:putative ZDHHC-type palmitoyltransferase 5 [Clonorchis sinensis]